jgi:hypothetical protein
VGFEPTTPAYKAGALQVWLFEQPGIKSNMFGTYKYFTKNLFFLFFRAVRVPPNYSFDSPKVRGAPKACSTAASW